MFNMSHRDSRGPNAKYSTGTTSVRQQRLPRLHSVYCYNLLRKNYKCEIIIIIIQAVTVRAKTKLAALESGCGNSCRRRLESESVEN